MVLLYILTLGMISLPTGLAKHFVVETAGIQRENDYIEAIDERKEIDKFVNEINKKGNDYGLGNLFVKKQGKWQMNEMKSRGKDDGSKGQDYGIVGSLIKKMILGLGKKLVEKLVNKVGGKDG